MSVFVGPKAARESRIHVCRLQQTTLCAALSSIDGINLRGYSTSYWFEESSQRLLADADVLLMNTYSRLVLSACVFRRGW